MADNLLKSLADQWKSISILAGGAVAIFIGGWAGQVAFGEQVGLPGQMDEVYRAVVTDSLSLRVSELQATATANYNALQKLNTRIGRHDSMLCNPESVEVMGLRRQLQCEDVE